MTLLSHVASQQKWLKGGDAMAAFWTAGQECRTCARIAHTAFEGGFSSPWRKSYNLLIYNGINED
jgi:hypothetical protein